MSLKGSEGKRKRSCRQLVWIQTSNSLKSKHVWIQDFHLCSSYVGSISLFEEEQKQFGLEYAFLEAIFKMTLEEE